MYVKEDVSSIGKIHTGVHTSSADDVGAEDMGIRAVVGCAALHRAAAARRGADVRTGAAVRMGAAGRMRIEVVAGVGVEGRGLGRSGRALVVADGSLAEGIRFFERTFFFWWVKRRDWLRVTIGIVPALLG